MRRQETRYCTHNTTPQGSVSQMVGRNSLQGRGDVLIGSWHFWPLFPHLLDMIESRQVFFFYFME